MGQRILGVISFAARLEYVVCMHVQELVIHSHVILWLVQVLVRVPNHHVGKHVVLQEGIADILALLSAILWRLVLMYGANIQLQLHVHVVG